VLYYFNKLAVSIGVLKSSFHGIIPFLFPSLSPKVDNEDVVGFRGPAQLHPSVFDSLSEAKVASLLLVQLYVVLIVPAFIKKRTTDGCMVWLRMLFSPENHLLGKDIVPCRLWAIFLPFKGKLLAWSQNVTGAARC